MDDGGITLTGLTIGGAALTTIGGLLGAYLKARYGRTEIHPQPLPVQLDHPPTAPGLCDERHKTIKDNTENLFARVLVCEKQIVDLAALQRQVESMDRKLDMIIRRMK